MALFYELSVSKHPERTAEALNTARTDYCAIIMKKKKTKGSQVKVEAKSLLVESNRTI